VPICGNAPDYSPTIEVLRDRGRQELVPFQSTRIRRPGTGKHCRLASMEEPTGVPIEFQVELIAFLQDFHCQRIDVRDERIGAAAVLAWDRIGNAPSKLMTLFMSSLQKVCARARRPLVKAAFSVGALD